MTTKRVTTTTGSAVATGGTLTLAYPANTNAGSFAGHGHTAFIEGHQSYVSAPTDFSLTFGTSNITFTWNGATAIPVNTRVAVELNEAGDVTDAESVSSALGESMRFANTMLIDLGAPDAPDTDGICTVELLGSAGNLPIDGAAASGGVATLDVPRNVTLTVATTNQSGVTFTVTGTDEYGVPLVEQITGPNNNTVAGKKAFKTVTQVAASAAIATNGVSVGFGDVLGLPVYLPGAAHVLAELEDGAAPTAGTTVAGVDTLATATTGDVRGTYDPNSACNGAKVFQLIVALPDPAYTGVTQYGG